MLAYCRNIFDDFKQQWKSLLGCEILFKAISLAFLGPVMAWIVFQLIALSGREAISNVDIASFLLSPLGWLTLIVFAGLAWAVTFIGQSGLILIQIGRFNGNPQPLSSAIMATFRRAPALIRLAMIFVLMFLLTASPFLILAFIVYRRLLSDFDINYYLIEQPSEFWWALILGGVLAACLSIVWAFVYARTLFALPECILNLQTPIASLKRSIKMTRHQSWSLFKCLVGWFVICSLAAFLTTSAVQLTESIALRAASDSFSTLAVVIGLLLTLNFVAVTATSIFGNVTQALLIGRLYWSALKDTPPEHLPKKIEKRENQTLEFSGLAIPSSLESTDPGQSGAARLTLRRTLFPALLAVSLASFGFCYLLLSNVKLEDDIKVTAHRGSSKDAPENTLSAIRQAIEDGADFAEIDVQETSDGVIVVMHDADFMRIAGLKQNIWDTPLNDLKTIDAGRWFDESFGGERIPTLQQVIDESRGKLKLNIELKFNGHDIDLVVRTLDVVKQNKFGPDCVFSSLDHESLKKVSAMAPAIKAGAIVGASIGDLSKLEADFISVNVGQVNRGLIRDLHRQGKEIHVWTVNDLSTMSDMIDLDVDNILTDEPRKLIGLLEERRKLSDTERLLLAFRKLIEY